MRKKWVPKKYQKEAVKFILDNPRCCLWAGMGTGKTSTVLTALAARDFSHGDVFPALVVAPLKPAASTWPDEAAKWDHLSHLTMIPIIGDSLTRKKALRKAGHIYTINFENISWLVMMFGKKWPFKTIIVDEATKLKNYRRNQGGTRARDLSKVAWDYCDRFIELSGTPSPNGLQDLWGQMWFIDQGERLGRTFSSYVRRWFTLPFGSDHFNKNYIPHIGAQPDIQERISDVCLSIEGSDYLDIKQPIVNKILVDLPPEAMKTYKEMEKKLFTELEGHEIEAVNAGAKTVKCLQIANGQIYTDDKGKEWTVVHKAKIEALERIIEEAAGMPVLVSYIFKHDLWHLKKHFPKGRVLNNDPQTIRDWNKGKIPILFAHPASAGHGLNLQDGSNILAFYSHDWNLENHLQIIERIGPMRQMQSGHDRAVYIHHIVAKGTVEEWGVMERLRTKRKTQDILMDALKRQAIQSSSKS